MQCALSHSWKTRQLFALPISYLTSGFEVISAKNPSKSNEIRTFAQSWKGIWMFFLNLEFEQALFYVENLLSWNNTDLTYSLSFIVANKNFIIFSRFKVSITHLSINFRKFVFKASMSKKICYFSFLSTIP